MTNETKNSTLECMDDSFEMFRNFNNPELIIRKIPTGFSNLDKALGGGLCNGIHTICAQPGAGKTTFTLNIAVNMAKIGTPVIIISYEMPQKDLMTKMYSLISSELAPNGKGFSFDDIRTEKKLSATESKLYSKTCETIESSLCGKIYFLDGKKHNYKTYQIIDEIEMFVQNRKQAPLIIVDYLQTIALENESTSLKTNIENAMSALHNVADEYQLPIIAISAIAKQGSETLNMFSGAEAARIAYGSVTHWGLTDETTNPDAAYNTVKLELFKNRYGKKHIAPITFSFDGEHSRFTEFTEALKTKGKKTQTGVKGTARDTVKSAK